MNEEIEKAVEILNSGGIIIFPTDTAVGMGCRIDNVKAVEKVFEIRNRPTTQATPVLVSSYDMAKDYLRVVPQKVKEELMDVYWPGALTIVLPAKVEKVSSLVRGGTQNLGVRMSNNEKLNKIIDKVGVPILGPSANFHGMATPYSIEDLDPNLINKVDMVVGGICEIKGVSTVVDCTTEPWKILRQGAVSLNI